MGNEDNPKMCAQAFFCRASYIAVQFIYLCKILGLCVMFATLRELKNEFAYYQDLYKKKYCK